MRTILRYTDPSHSGLYSLGFARLYNAEGSKLGESQDVLEDGSMISYRDRDGILIGKTDRVMLGVMVLCHADHPVAGPFKDYGSYPPGLKVTSRVFNKKVEGNSNCLFCDDLKDIIVQTDRNQLEYISNSRTRLKDRHGIMLGERVEFGSTKTYFNRSGRPVGETVTEGNGLTIICYAGHRTTY
jgi:hypothetical protein